MKEVLELSVTLDKVAVDVDINSRNIIEIASRAASRNVAIREWLSLKETEAKEEFRASIEKLENATSQILEELDVVRSRQAASAAVQASQVILMVTYFLTILTILTIKHCQKVNEKSKRKEFERLEIRLSQSKAKRRAAAAKEKSVPAQSLE